MEMESIFLLSILMHIVLRAQGCFFCPMDQYKLLRFMPVGTNATVKAVEPRDLEAMGFSIILANTYHLFCGQAPKLSKMLGDFMDFLGGNTISLLILAGFKSFL